MKKIISLCIVLTLVLSLAACGTKDTTDPAGIQENNEAVDPAGVKENDDSAGQAESTDEISADTEGEDTSLDYIKNKGTFILGLDDSFPPMGFRDDADNIVGFDIDLAKAVCEKLGVELILQPIEWEAKEQELNTKNIDCIWNGFSITPDRLENLTMTKPYMENNISLVVTSNSEVASMADMTDKSLAVQSGSSAEEALNSEENTAFRDSLGQVNPFGDYVTALMDLETGNSDAVLMDTVVANYMIKDAGKDFKVLDETLLADEYAIGFRKGEDALANEVWDILKMLKADGTVTEISNQWFGSDITLIP